MVRVAAVIPALNEAPSIGLVVRGLHAQTRVPLQRIIVVDNGSSDETAVIARSAGATL